MPVLRNILSNHRPTVLIGVLCVCIVTTLGFVRGSKDHIHRVGGENEVGVMGHNSIHDQLGSHEEEGKVADVGAADMLHSYQNIQFSESAYDRSLEERLLAAQGQYNARSGFSQQEGMLNNPHSHISIPQLPFCKPTRSTVGGSTGGTKSASSEEARKTRQDHADAENEEDSKLGDHELDDVEIVSTADGLVESERQFLVATLDGKVTLLNKTGHQLWTVKTGPLFSSTISSLQLNDNGKWINLIPSLTGGVYKYDGDGLYPMPFNADSLLKKSFKLSQDVVITGGKELRTFGIDVGTGDIRYECGISGCVVPSNINAKKESSVDPVILVVKKQMQTVRAIDSSTGVERWNFSVGTHELALAGVTEGCYHGEQRDMHGRTTDYIKVVIPEGRVFGADRENHVVWDHKFESPISQAWILENGQLVSVDPITNTPLADVPSLYIGIHDQQFYVQESQSTAEKMERYFGIESLAAGLMNRRPLNIAWRPPAAIDGVSGSTALSTLNPTPNWVSFAPTPNFRPIYIYDKDTIGDPMLDGPNVTTEMNEIHEDEGEGSDSEIDEEFLEPPNLDFSEGMTEVIVMSLWFWWKEVLGISLLTAVLLNLILMKPIIRAVRRLTIREMSVYFQQLWNRRKEEEETTALLARHSSNLLSLPAPNPDDTVECNTASELTELERRKRSTSCSSSGSMSSPFTTPEEREVYFMSQYLNEFIPIACLGRGGFGVVFEAKKKIDDRTYAVKRITLPDREKARVRVMREVKALAQLDHRNIVRYFNAWIESPPPGWQEKNDPLWAQTLVGSVSPTMDYPSDIYASSMHPLESSRHKPDHSKISVPPTPSEDPEVNEDSFIVFETSTSCQSEVKQPSSAETSIARSRRATVVEQNETSIRIPTSQDTSVASSVSSVEGGGFFARRPTSLNFHSSFSSFHDEDNGEVSQRRSISIAPDDDEDVQGPDEMGDKVSQKNKEEEAVSQDVMYLYIQQELCQKRTLQDWLRAEKSREISLVVKLFSQIVEAVEYVHSKKLIHRDLKPSNIFLAEVTENGMGVLTVKIGDFGLATTAYAELETEKQGATTPMDELGSPASIRGQAVRINLTGHVGTHLYMSPEQFHRKPYDYKVDIYSLGLIFFELLVPFSTDMERYHTLSGVRKLSFPEMFKESYPTEFDLIRTMISHNPNDRPDAATINTWVKKHLLSLPDTSSVSRSKGLSDAFVGRSISSPAKFSPDSNETTKSEKKKPKFYKTQSVM